MDFARNERWSRFTPEFHYLGQQKLGQQKLSFRLMPTLTDFSTHHPH